MLMRVAIRPAVDSDIAFCEALSRANMERYHAERGIAWSRERFLSSWNDFENHLILADDEVAGLLRLQADTGCASSPTILPCGCTKDSDSRPTPWTITARST